jgi:prophage regulatory protein
MPDHSKSYLTVLRRKQVQARTGLPVSTMYCMMDKNSPYYDSTFPTQIRLSASSVGWIESEVETWIESRIRASRS